MQQHLHNMPDSADGFTPSHHSNVQKDITTDAVADLPSGQNLPYDVDTKPSDFRDTMPRGPSFGGIFQGSQTAGPERSFGAMPPFGSHSKSDAQYAQFLHEKSLSQSGEGFMGRLTESILKRHEQSAAQPPSKSADVVDVDGAEKPWNKGVEA